jgi:hypothetical protein
MKRLLVFVAAFLGVASAYLKSYEVTPTLPNWSGWAQGDLQHGVGQVFTANFDSICEVSLFTGTLSSGANYRLDVYDVETNELVAYQYNKAPTGDHTWLRFTSITPDGKFVRGKEYLLKVTRPNDSINYYYNGTDPYQYGNMVNPGGLGSVDLCARIYGKARVGGEFAVQSNVAWKNNPIQEPWYDTMPFTGPDTWDACIRRESELGVKYDKIGYGFWPIVQRSGPSQFVWGWLDTLMTSFVNHGVRPIMSFRGTPLWASCAYESCYYYGPWVGRPERGAIPRGLYEEIRSGDSINPDNYYAKYIYEFVRRYGPKGTAFNGSQSGTFWQQNQPGADNYQPVLLFEGFPEVPSGGLDRCWVPESAGGYWRLDQHKHYHPWTHVESLVDPVYRETLASYIHSTLDTLAARKSSLASVYARLVIVVDSAVKMACASPDVDTIRPMSVAYISNDDDRYYTMHDWLTRLESHGADEFFDVASLWGYAGVDYPRDHVATLQQLRSDLDGAAYAPRPCVFTEYGTSWPNPWSQVKRAYHVTEAYSLTQSANVTPPGYPALAGAWFTFTEQFMTGHHWSIIDDSAHDWQSWEPAYAYQQWSELTRGASFEGRLSALGGDPGETLWVHVFQYRDSLGKRFWIAWEPLDWRPEYGTRTLMAPSRSDTQSVCGVNISEFSSSSLESAEPTGWFAKEFDTFPVIVREGENFSRPDVVVDSVKMMPSPLAIGHPATAHVYFRNAGSDTTPLSGPTSQDYTWFVLRHDGDSVAEVSYHSPLAPNHSDSITISVASVPAIWHGTGLFDATANYGQKYVELNGMDDNDGYSRNRVTNLAQVDSPAVACGSHHNEPLVPLGLRTFSIERDTTSQTPCDSARVVQYFFGVDTVVHAADTSEWFCLNPSSTTFDTTWQFLYGPGKYRLFVQAKDSWTESELIPDSAHTYVYFDTTGPTGSILLNHGSRFTTSTSCTLSLAASDSISGVAQTRLMNVPKINLVQNGSFTAAEGAWSYSGAGSGYDTILGLAKLATGGATSVRQFIPAESISAYAGDSCVLQASVMALMHGGNALGNVAVWHYFCRTDTSLHDTSWTLIDSATFQDSLAFWGQSPYGGNNLTRRFLLSVPSAESGWVWRGGMVRVQAVGVNGATGTVYADQVALNGFQPDTGYAWWGPYDTLAQWSIGSGAGIKVVRAAFLDSAGNENSATICDTIILDPTPPVVHITLPSLGQFVNGTVEITGWAYDSIEVSADTWFQRRTLAFRHVDSTNWRPVSPDSISYVPAYALWQYGNPAVHLGYWNTTPIPNGQYYLKLTASDSAGNLSSCSTWVMVFHGGGGNFISGPDGGGTGMGEGSLFVGSSNGTVLHLSDDLDSLDCFQVSDSGSQAYVTAVLEVADDSLLVLDAANKRIHKLRRNGQGRRRLVSNLSQPVDLKRDANGNFYLADRGLHRIGKFRPNGTLVFVRGGLGADSLHFNSPEGIAVKDGLVYVADGGNNRIAVWDTSGNFKTTITGDFANPTSVMVTDSGAIYLTDGNDGKLKGITPLGGNIVAIGTEDSSKLRGLVLSENKHSLFSIAAQPNRVYKLRIQSDDSVPEGVQSGGRLNLPKTLSLAQPFPNPARTRLNIAYALPRATRVSVRLYDVAGKLVNILASGDKKPGYYTLTWSRQDAKGRSCACGVYFCTLSAENQRFSRKVILTE